MGALQGCVVRPDRAEYRGMGLYRRLFKGASRDDVAPRSPEDARAAQELSEELRDLKDEIRKLREALQDSPQTARRGGESRSRGGRGRSSGGSRTRGSFSERGRKEGPAKVPPDDAPTGPLVDYLKKHEVTVFEGQDDLARNEAFEHLARHLGQHFSLLANFYEKMKRAVATGRTTRVDIEGYSEAERSAAVQLGTLLYRHGMLKDFYYHRSPRKQLRVIPTKDGETQQFLTGGWLEIYVVWLLSKRLGGHLQPKQFQVLFNVKGTLPTGNEFEADLMASINGHLLWLECKTGQWQDYSARFRGLVKVFGTNRKGAGLVLIKTPDASTKARATDMLDMTLLSLDDVETYVDEFLDVPESERLPKQHKVPKETSSQQRNASGRDRPRPESGDGEGRGASSRRRRRPAASGGRDDAPVKDPEVEVIPTSPEDATPLENPEPAKRLGKVDLEEGRAIPRRRRRRRSRSRSADGEGAKATSPREGDGEDGKPLRKELPIKPLVGEAKAKAEATAKAEAEPVKPLIPAGMVAPKPKWPEVTEDKAAKDVEAKADLEADALDGDAEASEAKPKRPRRRRRTKKVISDEAGDVADASEAKVESKSEGGESSKAKAPAKDAELEAKQVVKDAAVEEKSEAAEEPEAKKATKPRAKRKTTRARRKPVKAEAESREDSDSVKPDPKLEQADLDLNSDDGKENADADKPADAKPVRKKRASRKKTATRPKAETTAKSDKDLAEGSEANTDAKANADAKAKPKVEAKPEPKAEAKPETKPDPKKSVSGVTIMPDLSAMMAGSAKPEQKKDTEDGG